MPTTTTTLNMNLILPVPGPSGQIGPTWAQNINDALSRIDTHNHTTSLGVNIPLSSVVPGADYSMTGYNLTDVKSLRLSNLGSILSGTADKGCVYEVGGDLFFNNAAGTAVQITAGAGLSLTSLGTIGGDYSTSTAALDYSSITKTFTFKQNPTTAAKVSFGDIILYDITGGISLTIKAPAGLGSTYILTMPTALALSTLPLLVDSAGNTSIGVIQNAMLDTPVQESLCPAGTVLDYAGSAAPSGWLVCDGSSVLAATYASLFSVVGYTYGGSGANFNLPDCRGRGTIGAGTGPGLTPRTLAATLGSETIGLIVHDHTQPTHNHLWYYGLIDYPSAGQYQDSSFDSSGAIVRFTQTGFPSGGARSATPRIADSPGGIISTRLSLFGTASTADALIYTSKDGGENTGNSTSLSTQSSMGPAIVLNKIIKY